MKKVIILIGSYCSGKTEIALNMAVKSSEAGRRTLVVDLDRINDYFRMSDHIEMLLSRKIDVVSPAFAGKGVTQTVMPARVASAFDGVESCYAIQAGREIRIMVRPERVSDEQMTLLAREICKKIEADLDYPGQIKVNMIRESRAVDYAK